MPPSPWPDCCLDRCPSSGVRLRRHPLLQFQVTGLTVGSSTTCWQAGRRAGSTVHKGNTGCSRMRAWRAATGRQSRCHSPAPGWPRRLPAAATPLGACRAPAAQERLNSLPRVSRSRRRSPCPPASRRSGPAMAEETERGGSGEIRAENWCGVERVTMNRRLWQAQAGGRRLPAPGRRQTGRTQRRVPSRLKHAHAANTGEP